ncbi:MAG TPA: hypothetical protein VJT31_11690 [Rugosimonospora sp.]|nr:hypothetical protein [Rugosimonospora sp.]
MSTLVLPESAGDIRVLGRFARGQSIDAIATGLELYDADVEEVVARFAGGDRERAAEVLAAYERHVSTPAAEPAPATVPLLTKRPATITAPVEPRTAENAAQDDDADATVDDVVVDQPPHVEATTAEPAQPDPVAGETPVDPQPAAATDSAPVEVPGDLLAAASTSPSTRTRVLAEKIRGLVAELAERLATERAQREADEHARRELAGEVAELERQLADKREQLRRLDDPAPPAAPVVGPGPIPRHRPPTDREVRTWARDNHLDCNPQGRVPRHLVDAYLAAAGQGAAT